MALRIEKTAFAGLALALTLAPPAAAEPLRYQARHDHWRKHCAGLLEITPEGVSYTQTSGKKQQHRWQWSYVQIQQLELGEKKLRVLSYKDGSIFKLGSDVEYEFDLTAGDLSGAYALLKDKLDQRLVAAIADAQVEPLWELPVKRLGRLSGVQGTLKVGRDRIVFETAEPRQARTWRYSDIENVSSSGPFQLTLTTHERARTHYGNLRDFNFQLKEPLDRERYTELWRRLNQVRGLPVLTSLSAAADRE